MQITANGTACDTASVVTSLSVDGQAVSLSGSAPCLDFSSELTSQWGLNLITALAQNQVGATTNLVQSYLRSPQYFGSSAKGANATGGKAASEGVPTAIRMNLNQALVDDNDRRDPDDMATLFQVELNSIDLNAQLPQTLRVQPDANGDGQVDRHTCNCFSPIPDITIYKTGYRVTRGTLSTGGWSVNYAQLSDAGLKISASLEHPVVPVTVTGYLDPGCTVACTTRSQTIASVSGTVGMDRLDITATFSVRVGSNGLPQVDICSSCVSVDTFNPYLDIDFGALEFLDPFIHLSDLATTIVTIFKSQLQNIAESAVRNVLPPTLQQIIDSLRPEATVTLPAPMNTVLNLGSTFDQIQFGGVIPDGYLLADLSVAVTPAHPVMGNGYGSIRRDGSPPSFSATGYALGVGLKDDFINQFLWAAWSGGALELDQIPAAGCDAPNGASVSMSAKLPPVVMPGTNGHQLDIGLGDVYLVATDPLPASSSKSIPASSNVTLYASGIVGASVSFDTDSGKLVLTPEENPRIEVQIVSAPEGADLEALASQYAGFLQCALPELLSQIVGALPVFSLPIGSLGVSGIPPETKWVFGDDAVAARPDPYFSITGSVVVK